MLAQDKAKISVCGHLQPPGFVSMKATRKPATVIGPARFHASPNGSGTRWIRSRATAPTNNAEPAIMLQIPAPDSRPEPFRLSLLTLALDPKIIRYRKDVWNTVRPNIDQIFVTLVCHYPFQRYMAVPDNNVNGRNCPKSVAG